MKHGRYEGLLLDDRPLAFSEQEELGRHLSGCAQCAELSAGWSRAEGSLGTGRLVAPRPGFLSRWSARQAVVAEARARRQAWRLFAWASVGATALAGFLAALAVPSFPILFANILQQALRWWIWARMAGEFTQAITTSLPAPITAGAIVVFVWLIAGAGLVGALGSAGVIRFSYQGARK